MPPGDAGDESEGREAGRDPSFYEALGTAIKVSRTEQGLSRKELAARAGVSYPFLADIESGRGRPSSSSFLGISRALGLSPSTLMAWAESYQEGMQGGSVSTHLRHVLDQIGHSFGDLPAPAAPPPSATHGEMAASVGAIRREELHRLIDELADEDVPLALELARRLLESSPPGRE